MRSRRLVCLVLLLASAAGPASRPTTAPTHTPEAPTPQHPVSAAIWLDPIQGDSDANVRIVVRIAPGHWLYATAKSDSPFTPVKLTWDPGPAIREVGVLDLPTPDSQGHYSGDIAFVQHLRLSPAAGKNVLSCKLTYQACNSDLCWPPRTIQLKTELEASARNSR